MAILQCIIHPFRARFSFSTPIYDEIQHLLDTIALQCIRMCSNVFNILCFSCQGKSRDGLSKHMVIFVVNIRQARTLWNSTHCLLSPFTLDWSRNLLHNPMWNMAVNNISYPIYLLSTRTEKGCITKIIPFYQSVLSCIQYCSHITPVLFYWLTNICYDVDMNNTNKSWSSFTLYYYIVYPISWPNGNSCGFAIQGSWVRNYCCR